MLCTKLFLILYILQTCYGDWVSDWMAPIQDEVKEESSQKNIAVQPEDDDSLVVQMSSDNEYKRTQVNPNGPSMYRSGEPEVRTDGLKTKLAITLESAKSLAKTLKEQIITVIDRENILKEAISNGRLGVTTVRVSTLDFHPRTYIIRDGFWSLCNGIVQQPVKSLGRAPVSLFHDLFASPKCIGQEISSKRDPCAFNSIIKYETIPEHKSIEYVEDDYLCLKPGFNNTMEQYLSVPRKTVNSTCKLGVVRTLSENIQECGIRAMSEYTFYPYRSSSAAALPLEYCTDKNGACQLIVAWHISNSSIENFEFLSKEPKFQDYFIKSGPPIEHII